MNVDRVPAANRFDALVVGGGHNGLVAAALMGQAGLRVGVLEARDRVGGPCANFEFLPGYRTSITNSPGALNSRVVDELGLEELGLRYVRQEPMVVHHFPEECFIAWRDQRRVDAQLDSFSPGEAARYHGLMESLENLADALGVSVFEPSPSLVELAGRVPAAQERLFSRVVIGSLREILEGALRSEQARAILGMISMAANMVPPSSPGTAMGLMLRLFALRSTPPNDGADPRRLPLRGSKGLPVGGMGAIVEALIACCQKHGVTLRTDCPVTQVCHANGAASGAVSRDGEEFAAPVIVSSVNPHLLFGQLLDNEAVGAEVRHDVMTAPMRGSTFKMVLAVEGLPRFAELPDDVTSEQVAGSQLRVCPSMDYLEASILDAMQGKPSAGPLLYGLIPSVLSPDLAPPGHHLVNVNVWHAPTDLREGSWKDETERFGQHCIQALSALMPDLPDRIVGHRFLSPVDIEDELGLVGSNITHGDMLPGRLFGCRPHEAASDYRTPLRGLYLTGAGVWPGGYVSAIPGFNTARTVLADLEAAGGGAERKREGTSG